MKETPKYVSELPSSNPEKFDSLAQRIRKCAELAGSGDALSQKTAIPRRTLETYLSGESEPKAGRLAAIARAARVTVDWLATGEGAMHREAVADYSSAIADPVLLQEVITGVEEYLEKQGLQLSPDKKGELISLLYDYFKAQGRVEKSATERFLKLVIDKK